MASPRAVADADARPGHIEDRVVGRRDPLGAGDVDAGDLFPENAAVVDEVVGNGAFVGKAAPRPVREPERPDEADRAVAGSRELAPGDTDAPVVVVDEDAVSAHGVEPAVLDGAAAGAVEQDGPAAVDGPVA